MKLEEPKNPNYCAEIVQLPTPRKHVNADRLQCWRVFGSNVITDLSAQEGTRMVYFPVEAQLSPAYLSANNMYRHEDLNADKTQKGYFEDNGRIKAIKLRGEQSEGLVMPLSSLESFGIHGDDLNVGDRFDAIDGKEICRKYVVKTNRREDTSVRGTSTKKCRQSKIVHGQFRFHKDIEQFKRSMFHYNPSDLVTITYKMHGTSGVSARILCNKPYTRWQSFKSKIGFTVEHDTHYDDIYSSRKVIKNDTIKADNGFYSHDIWQSAHDTLVDLLLDGMTLYYEIVGFLNDGGYIQNGYDYGCESGKFAVYVYRGTYTSPSGQVWEIGSPQLFAWCEEVGIKHVPVLFRGELNEIVGIDSSDRIDSWRDKLLDTLVERYTDKKCFMSTGIIPEEGVVIRKENVSLMDFRAHKLKSFKFLESESKSLDSGVADIESAQDDTLTEAQ